MTIYYVDPDSGSDSNTGLAAVFTSGTAGPWKTLSKCFTSGGASDEFRIKEVVPTSTGVNATFTSGSSLVTLSSRLTKSIYKLATSFTSVAPYFKDFNSFFNLTNSIEPQIQLQWYSTIITGRAAYMPITSGSAVDFSSYSHITFFLDATTDVTNYTHSGALTSISTGAIQIRLCSDLVGSVTVDTFTIPGQLLSGTRIPYTLPRDGGGALGSTIQSVAIYMANAPGITGNIAINYLAACNKSSLTLNTLIGLNDGFWWGIYKLDETNITLAGPNTVGQSYADFTSTDTLYSVMPYTANQYIANYRNMYQVSDINFSQNTQTLSGGWTLTGTPAQTGLTFLSPVVGGILNTNSKTGGTISSLFASESSYILKVDANNWTLNNIKTTSALSLVSFNINSSGFVSNFTGNCSAFNSSTLFTQDSSSTFTPFINSYNLDTKNVLNFSTIYTFSGVFKGQNVSSPINNLLVTGTLSVNYISDPLPGSVGGLVLGSNISINQLVCNKSPTYGASFFGSGVVIGSYSATSSSSSALVLNGVSDVKIYNLTTSGNNGGVSPILSLISTPGEVIVHNWTYDETNPYGGIMSNTDKGSNVYTDWKFISHKDSGIDNNHITFIPGGYIQTDLSRVDFDSIGWKMYITSKLRTKDFPISLSVARLAVNSGSTLTLSGFIKSGPYAYMVGRLRIPGGILGGITSDILSSETNYNSYNSISVSCTPTESGIVEVFFDGWTPGSLYSTPGFTELINITVTIT